MDAALRRQAIKEAIELNKIWYESGAIKGEPLQFTGADLRGVDFSHADLRNAKFSNANLSHSNFSDTNLTDADMSRATLFWRNIVK